VSENKPVYVTQPALPSLDEYTQYLKQIWEAKIITNNGPFHTQFEQELAKYLGVRYISLFSNGTLALMIALKSLRITGEVITTPFSFVATTHSLWWNNIKPVFADIDPDYFNLDPEKVEAAITPQTTAIMPVHVFGNPCNLERYKHIAGTYGLKLIYDAAHAFGVNVNGESVINFGDLSVLSFHATKVFNTIEGGAVVCHDEKTKKRMDYLKNHGFTGETTVIEPGINAKMNELQAAYGLLQLKNVDEYIARCKSMAEKYRIELSNIPGIRFLNDIMGIKHNYSFFPIFVDAGKYGKTRDEVYKELKHHNIYGRRYFYPLISKLPPYREYSSSKPENLPIAEQVAKQVICLPIFPEMETQYIDHISYILKKSL